MRNIARILFVLLMALSVSCVPDNSPAEMKEMVKRLCPEHSNSFRFEYLSDQPDSIDSYSIETYKGKILIKGNTVNSMAVGLNAYLKNFCNTRVSWYASDPVEMPSALPLPESKIQASAKCANRFFLNYCTFGYTMPYWKWSDWERLIDWMALNGVNMPLAITGQESIWYKVWTDMGLTDEQIRSYFTGPAHLPWHRMSNVDYWQSPLPESWLENQEELQKKILKRERSLGMTPVLPAFAGHVPAELKQVRPEAKIYTMSQWGGYDDRYRSHFIDPEDPLYPEIQRRFLEAQTEVYGTDHIYGIDPFNEVDSPDWNEEFLSNVSKKIYKSIESVDKDAVWLQMTWMFYHSAEKWTDSRIEAFLNAVPENKLVLLDYYCDFEELWRRTKNYYGKPYIWCYLGNFGGNTMLAGDIDDVDFKISRLFEEGGHNVFGVGVTLEGLDVNPLMYEYVFDKVWNPDMKPQDWIRTWSLCRGGKVNEKVNSAWQKLHEEIYTKPALCGQAVLINARPQLEGVQGWNTHPEYHYDNDVLWRIWEELLSAGDIDNALFKFDVINVGRQVLGNLFSDFRDRFTECYKKHDILGAEKMAAQMDQLIVDSDRLLSCSIELNMGKWIRDAREFGTTEQEKQYYEENARCIVSVWGQKGTQLNDYANRGWAGLTRSFYRERWSRFTSAVISAMKSGRQFSQDDYQKDIIEFEYQWTLQHEDFPLVSGENPFNVASELSEKYRVITAREQSADVLVVGGGTSGVAACIQAARSGVNAMIVEEGPWLGGMLTSAGVSAVDGNYNLRSGIFGEFCDSLAAHYGGWDSLKTGWVSNILFEPSVGNRIFNSMTSAENRLDVRYGLGFEKAEKLSRGWKVYFRNPSDGKCMIVKTKILIDATELGDVAAACGAGYRVGMDSRYDTGEEIAPEKANDIVQDMTYVAILKDFGPDADMTIDCPEGYDADDFINSCKGPRSTGATYGRVLWTPQEMIDYGRLPGGKYMINWPIDGNDYYANVIEMSPQERQAVFEKAKNYTKCFIYYIQTELGYKNLGIADDEFPTSDGFPLIPYHREARRIDGEVLFTMNHAAKPFEQTQPLYRTGIAVGDYSIDHHHFAHPDYDNIPKLNFGPIASFNVPLGALIPKGVDDLIVAEKSISVTNIMNGATRLQPVVMQIGQAAGALAALAVSRGTKVRDVPVRDVQDKLLASRCYIMPYMDLKPGNKGFGAIQRIGATGLMKGEPRYMDWSNQTWFASGDTAIIRRAEEMDAQDDPFHKFPIDLKGF